VSRKFLVFSLVFMLLLNLSIISVQMPSIEAQAQEESSWKYFEYPSQGWEISRQDYFGSFLEWGFFPVGGQHGSKASWNFTWCQKDYLEVYDEKTGEPIAFYENPIPKIKENLNDSAWLDSEFENLKNVEGFKNKGDFISDCKRLDNYPIRITKDVGKNVERIQRGGKVLDRIDILNEKEGWFIVELKKWVHDLEITIGFGSTITYSTSTNTITCTGGTEAAPIAFNDLWTADKAGSRQLLAPTSAAMDLSLTTQPKPTDKVALKLNLVITSFSVAGTVSLTGKDKDNVAQTEDVSITGVGTYVTSKWWLSIDAGGVDCTGTYTIEVTQSQWGVVWKTGTSQFQIDSKWYIGDGSTTTWFIDTAKQLIYNAPAGYWTIHVKAQATLRFGTLIDATTKRTSSGVSFHSTLTAYYAIIRVYGTVQFYSSKFSSSHATGDVQLTGFESGNTNNKVYNCQFDKIYLGLTNGLVDIFRINSEKSYGGINIPQYATVNDYVITDAYYGIIFWQLAGTIKNLRIRGCTYAFTLNNNPNNCYIINGDIDTWNINWLGTSTGKVYRQYEFDLTVVDKNGSVISGATVTLYDKDGNQVFQVTTGADGKIATQTVSRGWYQQSTGNTLNEYSPHNLTITKEGYQTYMKKFTLTAKTDWTIALLSEVKINPTARFNSTITTAYINEEIFFDGSMSLDPDGGSITNYEWNFGDGNTTSGNYPTITHKWTSPGSYIIELTVTDDESATCTFLSTIEVTDQLPIARFTYEPTNPYLNELVRFDASSSVDNDGSITTYEWNFGDGQTSSENDPETIHAYSELKTFNVTLTVTDNNGNSHTTWHLIPIQSQPGVERLVYQYDLTVLVRDQYMNPIEGADVEYYHYMKGIPFLKGKTDEYGNFIAKYLDTGTYTIRVTHNNVRKEQTVALTRDTSLFFEYRIYTTVIFIIDTIIRNTLIVGLVMIGLSIPITAYAMDEEEDSLKAIGILLLTLGIIVLSFYLYSIGIIKIG